MRYLAAARNIRTTFPGHAYFVGGLAENWAVSCRALPNL
jgi:hypothetical protein